MSTYLDEHDQDIDSRIVYLEDLLLKFVELFAEEDGRPYVDADEDDVIDLLVTASTYLADNEVAE